jgi:tetratricopeptide (TPR) repeat protein
MSPAATLIQGLYAWSFEQGHAYLKEHASEITSEFVDALRGSAMNLLTQEPPEPELAKAFAELAIISAIHLRNEHAKGLAFYCKGSILARLKDYRGALSLLDDAQAYLRAAGSTVQLTNCLYDTALCYDKLGEYVSALRLLKEVLQYQHDEKERADTLVFMLVLSSRTGNDFQELLRQTLVAPPKHNFVVRRSASPEEARDVCEAVLAERPAGQNRELLRKAIPIFLEDSRCHFFLAVDAARTPGEWPPYACGVLKQYREPFNEWDLLGLEAVCFCDPDTAAHFDVIEKLREIAQELNMHALCISESGLGQPATFKALLAVFGLQSVPSVLMQGAEPGLYSAFTDSPTTAAFFAPCISLRTSAEQFDCAGARAAAGKPLYRGEGRLKCASRRAEWDCGDLNQLASHFFRHGFPGRAEGSFSGTVHAQILHQGYVDQPTVSLSESFDVCSYYATNQHRREEGGVVFNIDTAALMQRIPVYDSLGTLRKSCPWIMGRFYESIIKVMCAFDAGRNDIRASGAFLERCHLESRQRVESFGGGQTLGPPIRWDTILAPRALEKLAAQGLSTADLDAINEEFEVFWNVALGKMARADNIDAATGTYTTTDLSRAYFAAFDQVRLKLKETWRLNRYSEHNHPGWDLSPFGYITKTIRDKEFFTCGDIPGDCIVEAVIVDKSGRRRDFIPNRRVAGQAGP